MLNKKQRKLSTPLAVAKNNLEKALFKEQKEHNFEFLPSTINGKWAFMLCFY